MKKVYLLLVAVALIFSAGVLFGKGQGSARGMYRSKSHATQQQGVATYQEQYRGYTIVVTRLTNDLQHVDVSILYKEGNRNPVKSYWSSIYRTSVEWIYHQTPEGVVGYFYTYPAPELTGWADPENAIIFNDSILPWGVKVPANFSWEIGVSYEAGREYLEMVTWYKDQKKAIAFGKKFVNYILGPRI